MRQNPVMVDDRNRPANRSVTPSVGTLIITGFTGNPRAFSQSILDSEHVETVSAKRSGTQLELKVTLSHPPMNTERLLQLVYLAPEYDVIIQGEQMAPVPTLVISLTPSRTSRSRFSRGKSRRTPGQPLPSPSERQSLAAAPEIGTTSADLVVPAHQGTGGLATGPERREDRQPRAIEVYSKHWGRTVAGFLAAGLASATKVIGRSIVRTAGFARRYRVLLAAQGKRMLSRGFSVMLVIISPVSNAIVNVGNGIFGTDTDNNSKPGAPESANPEHDHHLRD